jgi:N-methylhydantoinase A
LLGLLNPRYLLGGRMAIRHDLAREAIGRLAASLGLDPMATALGILSVVTANMVRAIRVISVQRGYDPRDYTLIAFGGAGPLHAARLAQELDIGRVLVPRNPGVLCAMGLLLTDLRADFAVTKLQKLEPAALPDMAEAFRSLAGRARSWFENEGIAAENQRTNRTVDMRYSGQNYELSVQLPDGPIGPHSIDALAGGFAAMHRRLYGFAADDEPVQLVTFRVEATGIVPKATLTQSGSRGASAVPEFRPIWQQKGGFVPCAIYDRDRLAAGDSFDGPAIVEQMDATTFVPAGVTARVDPWLNLILEPA